jgi:hypothetical protein
MPRVRRPGSPAAHQSLNRGSLASEVPSRPTLPCPEAATAIPCTVGRLLSHAHAAPFLSQGPFQTPLALRAAHVLRAHGTPCGAKKQFKSFRLCLHIFASIALHSQCSNHA